MILLRIGIHQNATSGLEGTTDDEQRHYFKFPLPWQSRHSSDSVWQGFKYHLESRREIAASRARPRSSVAASRDSTSPSSPLFRAGGTTVISASL
jgi:hypothetical protein